MAIRLTKWELKLMLRSYLHPNHIFYYKFYPKIRLRHSSWTTPRHPTIDLGCPLCPFILRVKLDSSHIYIQPCAQNLITVISLIAEKIFRSSKVTQWVRHLPPSLMIWVQSPGNPIVVERTDYCKLTSEPPIPMYVCTHTYTQWINVILKLLNNL